MARDSSEPMSAATPSIRALHLAAVWAFAVAQPLLDLIGRFPTFLVAHGIEGGKVVVFLVLLLLPVPAVLFFFTRLARPFHRIAEEVLHLLLIGLGVWLTMLLVVRRFNVESGLLTTAIALLAAAAVTWVYWRHAAARTAMSIAGVGVLVFPVFFLMAPGMGAVINFRDAPEVSGVEISARVPIFLVIFDELPAAALLDEDEQIDVGRFPAFAALAEESLWFRHAFTVSEFTIQAVPAILTGRYVSHDLVPTAADHPESIFTLLGGSYRIQALEPITQVCPTSLCPEEGAIRWDLLLSDLSVVYLHLIVPDQWTGALPPVSENWAGFGRVAQPEPSIVPSSTDAEATPAWRERWNQGVRTDRLDRFKAALASIDGRPDALHVIHTLLPHSPYSYLPSGQRYDLETQVIGLDSRYDRWVENPWVVAEAEKRHLLQVGFVDHLLGQLVARLRSVGIYDRALIVVTSDHGSSFAPGGRRRNLTETNWGEIIPVPLLIKLPGRRESRVIDRPVETVDILPTIADVVGVEIPWSVDGRSLLVHDHARETIQVMVRGKNRGTVRRPATELISAGRTALSERLARWGSGDWQTVLHYGPRPSLVGTSVSELPVDGEIDGVSVIAPERFLDVHLEGGFLPAMVRGYVAGAAARARRVELAVAVNGTIRATTVGYREKRKSENLQWDIVLGKESLRAGDNYVEIFVVEGPKAAPRLLRAWSTGAAGESKNLVLATTGLWGMEVSGFYGRGGPYRWTNGKARLWVPIDRQKPPHTIRIDINWTGPQRSPFRVLVDGCELIRVPRPQSTWSESLDLSRCSPSGDHLTIELLSDTFVPKEVIEGNPDGRTLGLAMNGVWLLND